MEKTKIYTRPMTDEERSENYGNILKTSVRYHLIDCLRELKYGRPVNNQKLIEKWINELNENLDEGVPFV